MNRREALQSLAALAASRLAVGDGPVNADEVDKPSCGEFLAGSVSPDYLSVSGRGQFLEFDLGGFEADDKVIEVWGDHYEVYLSQDCKVPGAYGGSYASMDAEAARELAVAFYMAAEEQERRTVG